MAAAVATSATLAALGEVPGAVHERVVLIAGHGAMLGTAVAWATDGGPRERREGAVVATALVALAIVAAAAAPVGAVAYAALPAWLAKRWWDGRLVRLGLGGTPVPVIAVVLGAALGLFLGGHMLLTAMLTFRYPPLAPGFVPALRGFAYDAGVQVLATECFFRGALFNRLQRQRSFAVACAVATTAGMLRYLVDPLRPPGVEVVVGTTFYLTLLGIGNAWLVWRFGTLGPALLASLLFFLAYRMLPAV
jgi:hypothetical protein